MQRGSLCQPGSWREGSAPLRLRLDQHQLADEKQSGGVRELVGLHIWTFALDWPTNVNGGTHRRLDLGWRVSKVLNRFLETLFVQPLQVSDRRLDGKWLAPLCSFMEIASKSGPDCGVKFL